MSKSTAVASTLMLLMFTGCAMDDSDAGIDPACDSDEKCDGASSNGFETFKGADGRFYFHLVGRNGQIVLRSQGYSSKQAATRGIEAVRTNGVDPANFKVLVASSGQFYANLYAQNHEIIATSETYTRKFGAQRGIETARALVAEAQQIRAARSGARFQTLVGADHQTYFHLRGKNGEVMLASEGYVNAAGAVRATDSVRENGKIAARYEVLQASDGQWFFHLKAGNGEIIGHGETYASKSNAQRAVDTLVALIQSELVADPRPAIRPARSLEDKPDLMKTLGGLADIAAGGRQLAYFGFAEQAQRPSGAACQPASAAQVANAYDAVVEQVTTSGSAVARPDLTPALLKSSRTQLTELLGTDSFVLCHNDTASGAVSSTATLILSTVPNGPQLVLEIGYDE